MSNTLNNVILHLEGINCQLELEVVSKPQVRLKSKRHTLINTIRCVIPPTRGRKPIRRRLKSYGGTGEKAKGKCLK